MPKHTKEAIRWASPCLQLHMLAQDEDLEPEEVLAIARVHAISAIQEAETVVKHTTGMEGAEARELVQDCRDNPLPYVVERVDTLIDLGWS